jgi:hypothetical protein
MLEIPLHNQLAISVDVYVSRAVVTNPSDKYEPATVYLSHDSNVTTGGNVTVVRLWWPVGHCGCPDGASCLGA